MLKKILFYAVSLGSSIWLIEEGIYTRLTEKMKGGGTRWEILEAV